MYIHDSRIPCRIYFYKILKKKKVWKNEGQSLEVLQDHPLKVEFKD